MTFNSKGDSRVLTVRKDPWAEYLYFAIKRGVTGKDARFYVHRAKQFFKYIKKPLRNCIAKDVKAFIDYLSKNSKIPEWQIEQARDALRLS